jgi:hypothetical protein
MLGRDPQPNFFLELPGRRHGVALPTIDMAGTGGANQARAVILGVGSALEAELPIASEPKNMNGPMPELLAVNFATEE